MGTPAGYVRDDAAAGAIRLDLNEAPCEAGSGVRLALLDRLAARAFNRYPEIDSRPARQAAAELYGWHAAGTLVGNGSNELLAAAVRALLPRGGTLVTLQPSFSMYPVLAARQGARLVGAGLEPPRFSVPLERLVPLTREADLVVLCSPNNPTGGEVEPDVLEAVLALGRPVIWDAAYVEFAGRDPSPWCGRHANIMVLRSCSKAWGLAGLRVGALLAAPDLCRRVDAELLPFGASWLVQAAFEAALECRADGERLVAGVVAERERLGVALAAVPRVEVAPSSANFLLLRVGGRTGRELAAGLAARDLAVRRLAELDAAGWIRVTVGAPVGNDRLVRAIGEVAHG